MQRKKQANNDNIPYLDNLFDFYDHIKARPPLHGEFDIREIKPDALKDYDYLAKPFRHSFYCIALFMEGGAELNAGFWKSHLAKPALYFKTPYQVVSWVKPGRWLKEYFIVFTESFMRKHKALADIIFDLPFFDLDKAIPFEIEAEEVALLGDLYRQILKEYQSAHADKFELVASYTHILLVHVRRLYYRYVATDNKLAAHINRFDDTLIKKFSVLVKDSIAKGNANRTVKLFAQQLATHPNHLNAVVKRQTNKTAIAFIHQQLVHEAKTLLAQTSIGIKDIAFKLGFNEAAHFNHFFKKQTGTTPALYRKQQ